ncbi:MAG: tripartite tricarboxylate transporter permease [Actinomycetota bacterium]|jgi:putative tricarboxylic transport membrane protein|nr:tripartite tricarboxylate transporter permease [Actinomycetota bacterium]
MASNLFHGLTALISGGPILFLILGMIIGMLVGMLPGLGTAVALSILLSFVYHMSIINMVALMLGAQAGGYYTASITAITLNTPGAPESYPTTLDGFPMTERGEGGKALAISAASTWMGGWIACIIFIGLIQVANPLITTFKAPDYVGVIALAIVLVGLVGDTPMNKIVISAGFGLMLSFVGSDPVTAVYRFTFGLPQLADGIAVVPFALGVFAITQMVVMYGTGRGATSVPANVGLKNLSKTAWEGIAYTFRHPGSVFRSAIIASLLGLLPGIGGFAGNYVSYTVGKRLSRKGREFGTGVPEGVMSAEGSSLSKEVASLLPAVALGVPSGIGMVLFIAAMSIEGIQPGEALLREYPSLPYTMMWVMAITALLSCSIGLVLSPWLSRVSRIRGPVLFPFIVGLAIIGSYAAATSSIGFSELAVFGLVGLAARKADYSLAAMIIGLVLGGLFNDQVHVTAETYGWSFLWRNPIADLTLLAAIVLLGVKAVPSMRRMLSQRGSILEAHAPGGSEGEAGEERPGSNIIIEVIVDAVVLVGSAWYFIVSLGYPSGAGRIPAGVSGVVVVIGLFRVVVDSRRLMLSRVRHSFPGTRGYRSDDVSLSEKGPTGVSGGLSRLENVGSADTEGSRAVLHESGSLMVEASESLEIPEKVSLRHSGGWREIMALIWFGGFIFSTALFGFKVGIPLAGGIYSLVGVRWSKSWQRALFVVVTVVLLYLLILVFVDTLHYTYSGIF